MKPAPWKHPLCGRCLDALCVANERAKVVDEPTPQRCCRCRCLTTSGLFVVMHPDALQCLGMHVDVQPELALGGQS